MIRPAREWVKQTAPLKSPSRAAWSVNGPVYSTHVPGASSLIVVLPGEFADGDGLWFAVATGDDAAFQKAGGDAFGLGWATED
jgi:hypothetical protein